MRIITVHQGDADRRADKLLFEYCPTLPKSAVYKAFRNKKIKRNGKRCRFDELLQAGDELAIWLPEDAFAPKETGHKGDASLFHPVFAGANYLLADKAAGVAVQPGGSDKVSCLTDAAAAWAEENLPSNDLPFAPAPCHRLDVNTSGLVLFARTPAAARAFADAQKSGWLEKEYLCICMGKPPKKEDTVTGFWKKDEQKNKAEILQQPFEGAKKAVTYYRVLAEQNGLSLLRVRLFTGRSHQIRAQMQALGCPLLGDIKYTSKEMQAPYGLKHQVLTAFKLSFSEKANTLEPMKELAGQTFYAALPSVFHRFFPNFICPEV